MGRALATLAVAALAAGPAGCRDAPVRLVAGRADTVVVNSRRMVTLAVHALDRHGRARDVDRLAFRWVGGDPVRVFPDGSVTCGRPADARVEVSRGRLSTRFVLLCRPIVGFRNRGQTILTVGGPPVPLPIDAVGVLGESVVPVVGSATVHDSGVAAVRAMHVHPRARGETRVVVEAGDCDASFHVVVNERVASTDALVEPLLEYATRLRLVPGEVRTWPVPAGDFVVDAAPTTPGAPRLTVGAAGAQCAGWLGAARHCLALKPALIVVRHPGEPGVGAPVDVALSVRRIGESPRRRVARAEPRPARAGPRRRPCRSFPPA